MLQRITQEVIGLESFRTNSPLMEEVKQEKMNNSYLRSCAFEFLSSLSLENSTSDINNYGLEEVVGIYLISLLSSFKTYELAHETLFSGSNLNF
jgi:hypothetical protein